MMTSTAVVIYEPPKPTGRPTGFTPLIANEICSYIAQGKSLAEWIRFFGWQFEPEVKYDTVMGWLRGNEAFSKDYAQARVASGDADADGVSDIRERVLRGEILPDVARVAIDALKWTSGKRNPKKYGEKHLLEVAGTIHHVPVTAIDPQEAAKEYRRMIGGEE